MYLAKQLLKKCLLSSGLELRRIDNKPEPPPVCEDFSEVLRKKNLGEPVCYLCPISKCTVVNGFSFSRANSWHPFVHAMEEYMEAGFSGSYSGSALERYYDTWKPENALQALIGVKGPAALSHYPAYAMHSPWLDINPRERQLFMYKMISDENRWFGDSRIDASEGYGLHGPVSERKGKLEYRRLTRLLDSVRTHGYNRLVSNNDASVVAIEKDGDYRFCIAHGQHRVAVLAALGHRYLPVSIKSFVRVGELSHWPEVYRGTWTKAEAIRYIDHLFDFDAKRWARIKVLHTVPQGEFVLPTIPS